MNLQQFAALKPGDKIENLLSSSKGEIASISDAGVHVAWAGNHVRTFFFAAESNAWSHWTKIEPEGGDDANPAHSL